MNTPEWLATALTGTIEEARRRLLFHGTIERFDGRITASSWEGLRWFAEDPVVAQSYCPESGSSVLWTVPAHRLDERFIPDRGGPLAAVFAMMGHDATQLDIERDAAGMVVSYRVIPGHPTWRDAHAYVTEHLGYHAEDGACWIKMQGDRLMAADWQQSGRLYMLERPADLRLYDMRGEGDDGLTGRQWMRTDRFHEIEDTSRWDGVIISDIHQSARLGHFGHDSIGLFDHVLARLRWHAIPCRSCDPAEAWYDGRTSTDEFLALHASVPQVAQVALAS